jgi:hypothetical protein
MGIPMPRVKHKKVFEWRAICRAIDKAAEPDWADKLSKDDRETLALLRAPEDNKIAVGRLCSRLWAKASPTGVKLVYCRKRADGRMIQPVAQVYLGADGRTLYAISKESYGPAVSKHTPFRASDRPERGLVHRHGRDGMWAPGVCEHYPNVLPRRHRRSLGDFCEKLRAAANDGPRGEWAERAVRFLSVLTRSVRPFAGVIVQYRRMTGSGAIEFTGSDRGRTRVRSPHGVIVDLQAPGLRDYQHVDLRVLMLGPIEGFDDSAPVHYAVCGWRADGSGSAMVGHLNSQVLSDMNWSVTKSRRKVVDIAREWAASKVRIPCT